MGNLNRKRVEEQLRTNGAGLSHILASARLGVWDWNIVTGDLLWSRECLEMFGLPPDTKMSYERFLEAVHPEDRERIDRATRVALETRGEYSTEMRAVWPDGSIHWIASRGRAYYDESGMPVRMSGAGMEVSQFKQTEEELERARAEAKTQADNLAAVLDAVPAATFFSSDRSCTSMVSNRAAYNLLRLPYGSNTSKSAPRAERPTFVILENGRELPAEELPVQVAARTGREVRNKLLEIRFADGKQVYELGHAVPLFDDDGKVRGAVGAFLDVTELKAQERELERARAESKAQADNLAAIFRAVPALTFIAHDRECRFMTGSGIAYELLNLPAGSNLSQSAPPGERPPFSVWQEGSTVPPQELPMQQAAARGEEVRNRELKIEIANGDVLDIFGNAVPLFDQDGNVRGAVGAYLDISKRKRAEEALRLSEERLRLAAQTSRLGFHDYDARKNRSFWTPEVYALTGIPEGTEMRMRDLAEIIHPEDRDHVLAAMQKALDPQADGEFNQEFRIIRRDTGETRWILNRGRTFFEGSGTERKPARNTGIVMDITDRRHAEEALRLSEDQLRQATRRFELALRDTPITVFTAGLDLRYKWVYNPIGPDSVESLIGKRDSEILERPEDVALSEGIKREVLRTGVPFNGDMTVHFKGVPHTYHVNMEATRDAEGQIVGLVCACIDLTGQKRTQAELEKLSRQRQLALDAAKMGWWHYDPATGAVNWDETFSKICGIEEASMPIDRILERLDPEDAAELRLKLAETMDPGDPREHCMECRVIRGDGSICWVEAYGKAEFTGAGPERRCVSCSGTVRDITERKRSAEALREHSERINFVTESSGIGFWFCDLPLDKLNWDSRVKEHFWLPPDAEVTMDDFYRRLHPDDRERARSSVAEAIANRSRYEIEYRTVASDGREKWIRAMGRTGSDTSGKPRRFDGITIDITERKRAEEALRQQAHLLDLSREAVFVWDLDGTIEYWNKGAERLYGYTSEEAIGQVSHELLQTEHPQGLASFLRQLREQGVVYADLLHRTRDGRTVRVESSQEVIRRGGRRLVLESNRDITERKQAEEALRASEARYREVAEHLESQVQQRTRDLEVLNDGLRALSSRLLQVQDEERRRIARDLHDSAGQILTALGLELSAMQPARDSSELTRQLQASQELVQMLHKEIRTTSYLLHPPLLDEAGLYSALSWYVQGVAQRSGINIRLDIADDFGRLPREIELVVFRLVQESLTNIHRHSGSKTASIRIVRQPARVTVDVQDQGKGISPRELQRIREGGSGVGIRGMRERLRQFGGDLNIDSGENGTRVLVNVPIPQETVSEDESGIDPLRTAV